MKIWKLSEHRDPPALVSWFLSSINFLKELQDSLCTLMWEIAIKVKNTYVTLQSALELSHVPERMICLVLREKSHFTLCCSFPGACLLFEVVESQLHLEVNHLSQLYPFCKLARDDQWCELSWISCPCYWWIHNEALGIMKGIKFLTLAPIVKKVSEQDSGRPYLSLSEKENKAYCF
jgi:hypothetical protein